MIRETVRSSSSRLAAFDPAVSFHHSSTQPPSTDGDRFTRLLARSPSEQERTLRHEIETEHELPDGIRHPAVLDRLRAWLTLHGEEARVTARACDAALATLPSEYTTRRRETESAVMLTGMAFAEFRALAEILPWLGGDSALDIFAAAIADGAPAANSDPVFTRPKGAIGAAPAR